MLDGFTMLGSIILFPALLVAGVLWRGYVFSVLWGWFMVPIFGLPPLAVAPAIGLAMVAGFLLIQPSAPKDEGIAMMFGTMFLVPLFAWLFGWIVHLFM